MRIITNNKKLSICILFIVAVLILIVGCSEYAEGEVEEGSASGDSQITGAAVTEILRACKYSTGDFCSEKCCISEEMCNGEAAYQACNLQTGEWEANVYKDSECTSECEQTETTTYIKSKDYKEETNTSKCTQEWKCVEEKYRGYQLSDCSWEVLEQCDYRCEDGECKPKPLCIPDSLKCDDNTLLKCDENGKEWILHESCAYDCEDEKCTSTISGGSGSGGGQQQTNCDNCIKFKLDESNVTGSLNCGSAQYNEYVTFKNECANSCSLTGWVVKDATLKNMTISEFTLAPSLVVRIRTGNNTINTTSDIFWNRCSAVWNNDEDTVHLFDNNGNLVINESYSLP